MTNPNYIHAGPLTPVTDPLCHWRFAFEDVFLRCDDTVLPGEIECAAHFIDAAHRRDLRDRPLSSEWRRFPPAQIPQDGNE